MGDYVFTLIAELPSDEGTQSFRIALADDCPNDESTRPAVRRRLRGWGSSLTEFVADRGGRATAGRRGAERAALREPPKAVDDKITAVDQVGIYPERVLAGVRGEATRIVAEVEVAANYRR